MPGSYVRVEIVGLEKLAAKLERMGEAASTASIESAVTKGAEVVHKDVIRRMRSPKTGRYYSRGGKGHRASAPGEAPAIDTGALVNSIDTGTIERGNKFVVVGVGTSIDYAVKLELGSSRVRARPFLRPSIDENQEKIKAVILGDLKRRINGS